MANKSAEESSTVCQDRFSTLAVVRDKLGKCTEEKRLVGKKRNIKQVNVLSCHLEDGVLFELFFTFNYSPPVKLIVVVNERRSNPQHSSTLQSVWVCERSQSEKTNSRLGSQFWHFWK